MLFCKFCYLLFCLKEKKCELYPPPQNGALTCFKFLESLSCSVKCHEDYDFVFTPPFSYLCEYGKWNFFSQLAHEKVMPWPDCGSKYNAPF